MSARQYLPIYLVAQDKPLIVYPAKDEVPLTDIINRKNLIERIEALYSSNSKQLAKGHYHILFAWNKDSSLMLDIWVHTSNSHSDSGPLLEVYTYENERSAKTADIASGDTMVVLGREEESRRSFSSIDEYLQARRLPDFPESMIPTEQFA